MMLRMLSTAFFDNSRYIPIFNELYFSRNCSGKFCERSSYSSHQRLGHRILRLRHFGYSMGDPVHDAVLCQTGISSVHQRKGENIFGRTNR